MVFALNLSLKGMDLELMDFEQFFSECHTNSVKVFITCRMASVNLTINIILSGLLRIDHRPYPILRRR